MASVNKVIILGNLGRDPETRHTQDGTAVCTINVATQDRWKDKSSGEMKEATEWHKIVFWGRMAEVAEQYLAKGNPVYVEGKLQTRKYTDKEGVEKYSTEIRADNMQLLGSKREGGGEREEPERRQARQQSTKQSPAKADPTHGVGRAGSMDDMDDDIPF
jgi:single-strand DNA-binding protein